MNKWMWIALGGGLGSILRYAVHGWVQRWAGGAFPLGTLVVNVSGCLLIGFLAGVFAAPTLVKEAYRLGLTVGVLGGFTTFSTFGLENFHLTNDGQFRFALLNMLLSCTLGLVAVWLGYRAAEQWYGV